MAWNDLVSAADPRWEETLRRIRRLDFHHLPGYVALEAGRRGANAHAFICENGDGLFMIPLMISEIPLSLGPNGEFPCDALAPYGYAGPLVEVDGDEAKQERFVSWALRQFIEYLRSRNICAAMMRFHPLLPPPLAPFRQMGHLVFHGETVWADLHLSAEQLWSETRHGFRHPINRMQRLGYKFELDPEGKFLPQFVKIYHETMLRVGADPQYFFSEEYFRSLRSTLGPAFVLAHVRRPDGEIVSSGIFTVCCGIVQFHLSGNSLGGEGSDASKFLLHGIRNWAKELGLERFHLGGGVGAKNDSLFNFKSGFASGRALFHTWRMILDHDRYNQLCSRWERIHGGPSDPIDGFFPAYRKLRPVSSFPAVSTGGSGATLTS